MRVGGYEDGYAVCDCFWGDHPASMVCEAIEILKDSESKGSALDLGCGEGKNAKVLADAGYNVVGIELSDDALRKAVKRSRDRSMSLIQADITEISGIEESYKIVIATGSLHCLNSYEEISSVIQTMQKVTERGGLNVISSFNDGSHDFSGHSHTFKPTLINHEEYLKLYSSWRIIRDTNITQDDVHPNNGVSHSHTITRFIAMKL